MAIVESQTHSADIGGGLSHVNQCQSVLGPAPIVQPEK